MSHSYRLILFALLIPVIKFLMNGFNLLTLARAKDSFRQFVSIPASDSLARLRESKSRVLLLFSSAGVPDKKVPFHQVVGDCDCTGLVSVFSEYPSAADPFSYYTLEAFAVSIGVFKQRMVDSLNPLYWLGLIIYAPSRFFALCGASSDNAVVKIIQALYWVLSVAFAFLFFFEKNTLAEWASVIADYLSR